VGFFFFSGIGTSATDIYIYIGAERMRDTDEGVKRDGEETLATLMFQILCAFEIDNLLRS